MTTTTSGAEASLLRLRITPRAARDEVVGWREPGVLAVRVCAPPVEGEANRAVTAVVARALRVPPTSVTVVRGTRGRDEVVRVEGLTFAEIETRLARRLEEKS
jgi:uncharacterized protein (TIGR00251 family)